MNLILFSIMLFSFYGYASFVALKYRVQTSISQSWYVAPKWLHGLAVIGYLVTGCILANSFLGFITAVCLAGVYVTPDFRTSAPSENIGHSVGAALAMILTQCLVISIGFLWLSYATIAVLLLMEYIQQDTPVVIKNKTWWLEVIIFTSYAIAIGLKIF